MSSFSKKLRAIGIDILGVLLIIGAILFGWIPGPGGIPLFLGGLALLAINHVWARRLLEKSKREGGLFLSKLFSDHPRVKFAFDILSVFLLVAAAYVLYNFTGNLARSLAIVLAMLALGLILGNRNRLQSLVQFIKNKT